MAPPLFRVQEHTIPCQHIREYPRALAGEQEDVLHLSVKQYIPLDNPQPRRGDVTIIGAHANGFSKELYEPLWEEILACSKRQGFRIRSIWIADVAFQGDSGVVNERLLGNDPAWHDHARDLLHLINVKRDQMPRPIVGIGHSFGGNNLTYLSLMHPRLLTTLILLDPVIVSRERSSYQDIVTVAKMSTARRDVWSSKEEAVTSFRKSMFYAAWDPRVIDKLLEHALRDVPTMLYSKSDANDKRVTLKTTRHQEVFTFLRPNVLRLGEGQFNHIAPDDAGGSVARGEAFERPEAREVFDRLSRVRPSVLFIYGSKSTFSKYENRQDVINETGTGIGGSGGKRKGRVKEVLLEGIGHLVAMEAVNQCAESIVTFMGQELERWNSDEEAFRKEWAETSPLEKVTIHDEWRAVFVKAADSFQKDSARSKL